MKNYNDVYRTLWAWLRRHWPLLQGRKRAPEAPLELEQHGASTADAASAPETKVSVLIPALNEARAIASVVRYAWDDPRTLEVIVIDDSSIDDTVVHAAAAGAQVFTSTMLGKGGSMRDALERASAELVLYLDGDLSGLRPGIISDLTEPLRCGQADFVKARFGRDGGRVTELTAKPMLKLFFPELAGYGQPLGGLIAARKSLLQTLHFEDGYGVDIGLLIDAHRSGARIAEVDIGGLSHESQSLASLALMAQEVGRVIFDRARSAGRLSMDQILAMYEMERQNRSDIDAILLPLQNTERLLLIDVQALLAGDAVEVEVARRSGRLDAYLAARAIADPVQQLNAVADVLRFVHQNEFLAAAQSVDLRPGWVEALNQARRDGWKVGIVSSGFYLTTDILRRRVFANFAVANSLVFDNQVCTGKALQNRAFLDPAGNLVPQAWASLLAYVRQQLGALQDGGLVALTLATSLDGMVGADKVLVLTSQEPPSPVPARVGYVAQVRDVASQLSTVVSTASPTGADGVTMQA